MLEIKKMTEKDIDDVTKIYNEAIIETVATFDTKIKTIDEIKLWFDSHGLIKPLLVAELNDVIVGWTCLSEWSDRCAYSDTAEISVYVKKEFQRRGIGRKLLKAIMNEGEKSGLHVIVGRITEGNDTSIHLLESSGFSHIGVMKEVGFKFGKRLDVYLMQKIFNE